jgi:hypothetical protein
MFRRQSIIYKNQFQKTIDHALEFEKLQELNKGQPDFEDDPSAADSSDRNGTYYSRSLAEGKLHTGVDMGDFRDNGEKQK